MVLKFEVIYDEWSITCCSEATRLRERLHYPLRDNVPQTPRRFFSFEVAKGQRPFGINENCGAIHPRQQGDAFWQFS